MPTDTLTQAAHAHRYRVEEPHDGLRLLRGVCGLCGAQRMFPAGQEESDLWNGRPRGLQPNEFRGGIRIG